MFQTEQISLPLLKISFSLDLGHFKLTNWIFKLLFSTGFSHSSNIVNSFYTIILIQCNLLVLAPLILLALELQMYICLKCQFLVAFYCALNTYMELSLPRQEYMDK